ncbi:cytochrome c oxidase biogenesis protein Cmc1 like-domain-containing protein [Xylariaceae sp. FL0662B]|nr:cytochrome c oxidase biogenesis protein Cmc1 like-domain-containing protein [Xylariaceae sp. FL0662B]
MAAMAAQQPPVPSASATTTSSSSSSSSSSSRRDSARGGRDDDEEKGGLPMPSHNPLPLSASQEAQVREVFHARVRKACADEIQAFAECARNRTVTIPFACRTLSRQMNGCMAAHATAAEHDRAREAWFAQRLERAREREKKERRRIEQERLHREWWGLPDRDPEDDRRDAERLAQAERVGGFRPRERGGGAQGQGQGTGTGVGAGEAARGGR